MPSSAQRRKALVVDDFPSARFSNTTVLQKAGFECRIANNGAEALGRLKQEPVDLVGLDLVMPEMGGKEFIEELHLSPTLATIPVLIISTEQIGQRIRQPRTASTGPVGFVLKPIMPAKIIEEIDDLLQA